MGSKVERKEVNGLVSRKGWEKGPWNKEPDLVTFFYKEDNILLPCLLLRHPSTGCWDGYVGVTEENPYYQVDWEKIPKTIKKIASINFSQFDDYRDEQFKRGIRYWYFGFNLPLDGSINPGMEATDRRNAEEVGEKILRFFGLGRESQQSGGRKEEYKTLEYVEKIVEKLAKKLIGEQKAFLVAQARKNNK
jgi:hypothetical protein